MCNLISHSLYMEYFIPLKNNFQTFQKKEKIIRITRFDTFYIF